MKNMHSRILVLFGGIVAFCSSFVSTVVPCDSTGWIHTCLDGVCILTEEICDGKLDCPDGSDERNYQDVMSEDGFECHRKDTSLPNCFLPMDLVCDQYNHCLNDESECQNTHTFQCSPEESINSYFFCDGYYDCVNRRDELIYKNASSGIKCFSDYSKFACAMPTHYRCDGKKNCLNGGSECFCGSSNDISDYDSTSNFDSTCFRCLDGNGEMTLSNVCNGFFDCGDLSDECLCENPPSTCKQLKNEENCEFQCRIDGTNTTSNKCIRKSAICNIFLDCPLGEDEKYCRLVSTIKENLDRQYDVDHLELMCCNAGYPADCLYEYTFTNSTYNGCDKFFKCPEDEIYYPYMEYAIKCDGVSTCIGLLDECGGCTYNGSEPYYCGEGNRYGFECPNKTLPVPLLPPDVCDGLPNCNEDNPHESADEIDCADRYYCTATLNGLDSISIRKSSVCDCLYDCNDGSDEGNCTAWSQFCCRKGGDAVSKDMVCNGVNDCLDGSDECESCIDSPFADDKYLIRSKVLRAFVWIIGICSSAGNLYVMIHTGLKLHRKTQKSSGKINSYQIIGLSSSDFCVGVYLICLGSVNAQYSGIYCYQDASWRSGNACNFIGVLSMYGIQASVFMLTMMTLQRLYTISRPFSHLHIRWTIWIMSLVLLIALLLAVIPIFPSVQDYFVSHVKFRSNPFVKGSISRAEMSELANKLRSYGKNRQNFSFLLGESDHIYSWSSLFKVMKSLNESFEAEHEFGYYSAHGVCLPKIFPTYDDLSWQYSIFIISINFILFFVIMASYIAIYRRTVISSSKLHTQNQADRSTILQRKITRIIITDFCCWIPICLIAFSKITGIEVADQVYAVAAVIILPINSAVNPLLYSDLPEVVWSRTAKAVQFISSSDSTRGQTATTTAGENVMTTNRVSPL